MILPLHLQPFDNVAEPYNLNAAPATATGEDLCGSSCFSSYSSPGFDLHKKPVKLLKEQKLKLLFQTKFLVLYDFSRDKFGMKKY
jgi:hypothetical protein